MSTAPNPDRPLPGRQGEARSNDASVLAAAREVFTDQGYGASMADISRRAGVGIGSIYRRYPTKEALIEALHLQAVCEAAALVREVADDFEADKEDTEAAEASGAMAAFLVRQITGAAGPPLRPPGARGAIPAELSAASDDLRTGLERVVAHDQALGLLPEGFTPADVMQILLHIRPALPLARDRADALHLRYLDLLLRGLREQAGCGVVLVNSPDWSEWMGTWHD